MTEFLTENAGRAYPLERWPVGGVGAEYARALLDASIGYAGAPSSGARVSLLYVKASADGVVYRMGVSDSDFVEASVPAGPVGRRTVFTASDRYRALLTVDGSVVAELAAKAAQGKLEADVGVPFANRCVTYATRFVESVSAYALLDKGEVSCDRAEFTGEESPVAVAGGDVVIASKDGVDVAVTRTDPSADAMVRVSALSAATDPEEASSSVDVVIRGDGCMSVEAIPGAYVADGGAIVPCTDAGRAETSCGVIRIGSKCRPCCQCEDYRDAAEMLRPSADMAESVKTALDEVKALYDKAVAEFAAAKTAAVAAVGSYDNVRASATAATSGGVSDGVVASGTRSRIAVTLLVSNMTLETCTVSSVGFTVPEFGHVRTLWATAGGSPSSGADASGRSWALGSGDSLTVVATYSKTARTNDAVKPSGMKASFTAALPANPDIPGRETSRRMEVTVA